MADFSTDPSVSGEEQHVRVQPAWDWLDLPPFVRPGAPRDDQTDAGRCFWLSDSQGLLGGPEPIWFTRSVTEVVSPEGLHETAQLDLDFDPAHERIVLHHVRVIRAGETREVDVMAVLSVFRRERDLEKARYDGRLTAHLVIPDVRVGDVVDIAHSSLGAPPMFAGRFSCEWSLNWSCWVGETRVRLLAPADFALSIRTWNDPPETIERVLEDGLVEREWRAIATPPVPYEPDIAPGVRRFARVRTSSPMTWAEVADVFRVHYGAEALPADLEAEVAALQADTADPAVLAVRLLRRVQSGLRYQAVSIGDGGFVPRPVEKIWGARSGDCKDASRLLVALLRRVGLDAAPALVNTGRGWALDQEGPGLSAFDHCIVRLRLAGREYWLDPTLYPQGGALDVLHQARFGWALPLVASSDLAPMGEDPLRDTWCVEERYDLGPTPTSPATLTVRTTFSAWRADGIRRSLASEAGVLTRGYVDYYSRLFGEVRELGPIEVDDDLEANVVKTVERYELSKAWTRQPDGDLLEFSVPDDLFSQHLTVPPTGRRRWPIDLGLPRRASWTTEVRLPLGVNVHAWDRVYEMPGVKATSTHAKLDDAGKEIRLSRTVEVARTVIPPDEAEAYFGVREAALRSAGLAITMAARDGKFVDGDPVQAKPWGALLRAIAIAAAVIFLLRMLALLPS